MAEIELVSTAYFKIAEKNPKYLGTNIIKNVEEIYDANHET